MEFVGPLFFSNGVKSSEANAAKLKERGGQSVEEKMRAVAVPFPKGPKTHMGILTKTIREIPTTETILCTI